MNKKSLISFLKFCLVGAANTAISLIVYYLLYAVGVNYAVSMATGYIISSIFGYFLNKTWVFKQKKSKVQNSIFKYYLLYGSSLILNLICMTLFIKGLGMSDMIAPILTIVITTLYNFIFNKIWVFKNQSPQPTAIISFKTIKKDTTLIVLLLLFTVFMSALFVNNYFNHPVADDYTNANSLINILPEESQDNYTFTDILIAIPKQAAHTYETWQGTYFANFLFFINPTLVSTNAYKITMLFVQVFWILGTWYFFASLPKHNTKQYLANIKLFLIFMIFSILSMYSLGEGLYWFTGSILYIIPFTLSLIFFGVLIRLFRHRTKSLIASSFALAIALGGTSYVTGLVVGFILLILVIFQYYTKSKHRLLISFLFATFCIGFAFNVFCPGNFARIDSYEKVSLLQTIGYALGNAYEMSKYIMFNTLLIPLLFLTISPISVIVQNITLPKVKRPSLLIILSILCFIATFIPMAYSYGTPYQETRVKNIQLLYLSIMIAGFVFYYLYSQKLNLKHDKHHSINYDLISLILSCIMVAAINPNNISGLVLLDDIFYGKSYSYDICMDIIENELKQPNDKAKISNCEVYPSSLHYYRMTQDGWQTEAMEKYYHKQIIIEQ